ncbi:MAG: hypothetical protein GY866_03050 [Proteobacteria bacterium]|nr:hypothetical protein [Pseudomonadota bacterium]
MIKNFFKVLNFQTALIVLLSLLTTFACMRFGIVFEMPTGLVGIAIVFPIVFSINAAYRRREEALVYMASFKSAAVAIYYAHRDWVSGDSREHTERIKQLIIRLFQAVRQDFTSVEEREKDFQQIYALFSQVSDSIETLRGEGVAPPDLSRANEYLRDMMSEYECMRNIYIYRTPVSLRSYTQIFLNAFPILFGPYFAFLSTEHFLGAGFLVAVFYSLVLVSLDNIQDELENPYDGIGVDDIDLDIAADYGKVL